MTANKANFKAREAQIKSVEAEHKKKESDEIQAEIIKNELTAQENFSKKEFKEFEAAKTTEKKEVYLKDNKPQHQGETPAQINFNPDIETMKGVMDLAAEKIVAEFFNGRMHYSEEELTKDLVNLIRSITKQDIVNKIFGHMDCPIIHVPGWDECGDNKPGSLEKCHNGEFVKCQYWTRYLIFRITKVANQVKEKK
jgi:hypothetical protein